MPYRRSPSPLASPLDAGVPQLRPQKRLEKRNVEVYDSDHTVIAGMSLSLNQ